MAVDDRPDKGGLGLEPGDLEKARMDSAKFQEHRSASLEGDEARPLGSPDEVAREDTGEDRGAVAPDASPRGEVE